MLLTIGEVGIFSISGVDYEIETNARFWINATIKLEKTNNENRKVDLFLSSIKDKSLLKNIDVSDLKILYNKIFNWYHCIYEKINDWKPIDNKVYNKAFDYDIDGGRIFSAFYQTYGIDIESQLDTIHWWKFKAMFNNLSSETKLVSYYMHYRNYDKTQYEYKSDKKGEVRKVIDNNIAIASFDTKNNVVLEESPLAKRRRIARENK